MASISFRVPPLLWAKFKDQTDALFISRAPFLDHIIRVELPYLAEDLNNIKLNTRTKRYIANALTKQDPVSVNIDVRQETADTLRDIIKEHNIVRDAFMCRLLIFLRATDSLLKLLEIPRYANDYGLKGALEEMPASPMLAMEAVRDDPLFYIRHQLRQRYDEGIYTVDLWPAIDWAACYLPPERVPGTGAFNKKQKVWASILELPETKTPAKTSRSKK